MNPMPSSTDVAMPFFEKKSFITLDDLNHLVLFRCDFNQAYYHPNLFNHANIVFSSTLENSVKKRQAEFFAGRYAAKSALSAFNILNADIPVGPHQSPVWPNGILGSITHTSTSALCAVALMNDVSYLGIDLENWLPLNTVQEIQSSIIQTREETLLRESALEFNKAFTLAFSAKESLFKALYPKLGFYFDFTAAEMTYISISDRTFELTLLQNLSPQLLTGSRFKGHFNVDEKSVLTVIVES
jgi:enterobactin synthetase component D